MAKLEQYISVGQKKLRCGYTTGTCAAAAARGAAELLLTGNCPPVVELLTPAGIRVTADLEESASGPGWASCAVRKDGGDDIDATHEALIFARVERCETPGVTIDGGPGVGRVTRPGLDQPVGNAAINHVPREMIEAQVREAMGAAGCSGGLKVILSVPEGEKIAKRTFNPNLGIEGGISILGTSGIVRPMSEDALIASIKLDLQVHAAAGVKDIVVSPGNYGADFSRDVLGLDLSHSVQCSNYIGATIDMAVELGFRSFLLVGHVGKVAKIAAGVMNTHSRVADGRAEVLAAHAALFGADRETVAAILTSVTTDAIIPKLDAANLREPVMESIARAVDKHLKHRAGENLKIEALFFSNVYGILGKTPGAEELMRLYEQNVEP